MQIHRFSSFDVFSIHYLLQSQEKGECIGILWALSLFCVSSMHQGIQNMCVCIRPSSQNTSCLFVLSFRLHIGTPNHFRYLNEAFYLFCFFFWLGVGLLLPDAVLFWATLSNEIVLTFRKLYTATMSFDLFVVLSCIPSGDDWNVSTSVK